MKKKTQRFDPRQEMRLQNYEVFHYRDADLGKVALHHHDFYEVYLFLSGDVSYNVEGKNYPLRRGDILLINPMELHQPRVLAGCAPYERYVLWLNPGYLGRLSSPETSLTRCFDSSRPNHTNHLRLSSPQWAKVLTLMEHLVQESYGAGYGGDVAAAGLLLQLMVEINRLALSGPPACEAGGASGAVVKVLDHINQHYDETLSLDELAARFFISKYHLSHEFNRMVGTSVYRYIILKRLAIAKQILMGGVPPTDAYLNCGFRDYTNFYRCFKSEYGISPKQFVSQIGSETGR